MQNGFSFSAAKTNFVHFLRLRGVHPLLAFCLNNHALPVVPPAKFLGLVLDIKFSWGPHLRELGASCERSLNVFCVLSWASSGEDRTVMLRLYRSLVRLKLDYGSFIYGSATQAKLRILDPVQNAGIRLGTGALRTSPVVILCVESGETPSQCGGKFFFVVTLRNFRPIPTTRPTVCSYALLFVTTMNGTPLPSDRLGYAFSNSSLTSTLPYRLLFHISKCMFLLGSF
jgi:hypothetical protein